MRNTPAILETQFLPCCPYETKAGPIHGGQKSNISRINIWVNGLYTKHRPTSLVRQSH